MTREYYREDGITILHGDSQEIMAGNLLEGIDLIVTDPPYGVEYSGGHFHSGYVGIKRERERLTGDDADVYQWAIPLMFKVCHGPCYVFFSDTRALNIYKAVHQAKGTVHALIIWHKTNAKYAAMNSQYKQRHEPVLYCKGINAKTKWKGSSSESTIWEFPRKSSNALHPTEKPEWLIEKAINNHDCDLVLDPFCGSGSTLEAAKLLGKKAIGIEINEKYCEIAANRLSQSVLQFTE